MTRKPKHRSRWWNGCFFVLALVWGLLLIMGFATTFDGTTWSRFGSPGWDNGPALAFFAGLGILYGVKWAAEAIWDYLGRDDSGYPPDNARQNDRM
jgi:hypothetical protein